eukprot:NODE_6539_length_839_cov_124.709497_g6303_i0.p1 GENE.NODE_6539_length_839_cov_124.709497_g6303_i0~~NODE_6539_length_839_cov_124.709497_g6303_i0.p1  ORF type:complete len:213 (+),score=68.81 NODE_6539_length_839_cov_124.709497_g6303_i0:67-705(+)
MSDEASILAAKAARKEEKKRKRAAMEAGAEGGEAAEESKEEKKKRKKAEKEAKKAAQEGGSTPAASTPASGAVPSLFDEVDFVCPIAKPFSPPGEKLTKRLLQLVNEGAKTKKGIVVGIKQVRKEVMKGTKGLALLGANVAPVDVVAHMPAIFEDSKTPYVWVPSRYQLGLACMYRRPVTVVFLKKDALEEEHAKTFDKVTGIVDVMYKQCF